MGALTDAANKPKPAPPKPRTDQSPPEFDKVTGELRIGKIVYKARRYTKKLGRELVKVEAAPGHAAITRVQNAEEKGETNTHEDVDALVQSAIDVNEVLFAKVALLYADPENAGPSLDDLDELTYGDAQAAVTCATADPTTAATGSTSG